MNRLLWVALPLVVLGGCLAGCASGIRARVTDKGSYFIEFGTRVELGSEASETSSTAESDFKAELVTPSDDAPASSPEPETP